MKTPLAALSLCLLAGCSGAVAAEIREHTYPRDLRYVSRSELRTGMLRFAASAAALDHLLTTRGLGDPELGTAVAAQLHEMQDAAQTLEPGAGNSVHRELDQHLDRFVRDLVEAEAAARASPPNYYLAGTIVGACAYCHAPTREDAIAALTSWARARAPRR